MRTTFIIIQYLFIALQFITCYMSNKTKNEKKRLVCSTISFICAGVVFGMMIAVFVSAIYDLKV